MKKITALLIAILLFNNFLLFSVSAAVDVEIETISKEKIYNMEESVAVNVSCAPGTDLVIRVYNEKNVLIYTDVILAENVTEGKFEYNDFIIPKTNSYGNELEYTMVVSQKADGNGGADYDVEKFKVKGHDESEYREVNISGGTGGGTDSPIMSTPWTISETEEEEKELTADIDPLNPYDENKKLWNEVNKVDSISTATAAIEKITKATSRNALMFETARNNVATAGELMAANISAKNMNINRDNKLSLDDDSISSEDLDKLSTTMAVIEKAISDNKILLNRELARELVLNVEFDNRTKATIAISRKLVEKLTDVDILTVKDSDFKISYTVTELTEMLGGMEETSFEIDKSELLGDTKKISVNFDTDKTQTVKIAFPGLDGENKYMAIVDENGNPVGGRYNPTTGEIEAKISESGIYQVVENEKDFDDIKNLSREMQESIKILASKGIIAGTTETEFSPEDSISRAEIAALLLRVLSQVDPNADGGFADVKKSDWFFGTAGSAKVYGMIAGFEDNTFRGNDVIKKDQILAISARVLKKEMRYKTPDNIEEWLNFTDAATIPDWAEYDIALAAMANIITRTSDNTINADTAMTRGDAALIIMRLFYKIW